MKRLLRIDASARRQESHSRMLADYFETHWRVAFPNADVTSRDLTTNPPPHLDEATVAAFYNGGEPGNGPIPNGILWSNQLIAELIAADDVLISTAVYNCHMPSSLKAWVDHIVRFGRTIARRENRTLGLLAGKAACLLTARGGNPETGPDYQGPALQSVLRYLGFSRISWISLEGTNIPDGRLEARVAKARAEVDAWIASNQIETGGPGHAALPG
jgi:FMN-dependent NADH-azoreductase